MADWMVDASFFAALGCGTSQVMHQPFWFWRGCAAAGAFFDYVVDLQYHSNNEQKEDSN